MKNNILNAPFIVEYTEIIDQMYRLGWDERNAGNVSYLLSLEDIKPYERLFSKDRKIELDFNAKELVGQVLIITGTGKYFKNVKKDPKLNCGIIQINPDGKSITVLWGFSDGGKPTSELNTHLQVHIARLKINSNNRVVIHTHASHTNAMSVIADLDECSFSRSLWKINTENIIIFPEGVGIIPWEIPGNKIIGENTANKFKEFRIVIWPLHGVVACGETLDETFGLIETVEKAAYTFVLTASLQSKNVISDVQLKELAKAFNVMPNQTFLDKDKSC